MKRFFIWAAAVMFLVSTSGCIFLAAGAAGGGTAYWLAGKMTQTVNASFERTTMAARNGLKSMNLIIESEKVTSNVAQFRSKWTDGSEIWVDVKPITTNTTEVAVRVGATSHNKTAASDIMKRIQRKL